MYPRRKFTKSFVLAHDSWDIPALLYSQTNPTDSHTYIQEGRRKNRVLIRRTTDNVKYKNIFPSLIDSAFELNTNLTPDS
jgi:hypothetical protein